MNLYKRTLIMDNSKFIKITYSTEDVMLSGIYLSLPIKYSKYEDFYKKMRVIYDTQLNYQLLNDIYEIETMILNKYSNNSKNTEKKSSQLIKYRCNKILLNGQ